MAELKGITISLQNSGSYNDIQIEHDNREYDENGKPYFSDNVDKNRSGDNWYYEKNMSIKEFYEREFEPAYREQQQRNIDARHPERNKYGSYYEEVLSKQLEAEEKAKELKKQGMKKKDIKKEMAATTKVAYQAIVQLGNNKDDFRTLNNSPENIELAKKLLIDFVKDWEKKYPEMKIINAAIHCDEIGKPDKNGVHPGGTVHAQITYCPVCTSYSKGMSVRNSLTRTLSEMGFPDDKKKDPETGEFQFGIEKWQQKMRDDFDKHIQKFGYMRIDPVEKGDRHEDIPTYQKKQEVKKGIAKGYEELEDIGNQVVAGQDDLRNIRLEKRRIENEHEERVQKAEEKLQQTEDELQSRQQELNTTNLMLKAVSSAEIQLESAFEAAAKAVDSSFAPANIPPLELAKEKNIFGKETGNYILTPEQKEQLELSTYYNPDTQRRKLKEIANSFRNTVSAIKKDMEEALKSMPFIQNLITQLESQKSEIEKLKKKTRKLDRLEQLGIDTDKLIREAEQREIDDQKQFRDLMRNVPSKYNEEQER